MARKCRKRIVHKCLTAVLVLQMASCGTILYPERRGQPAGRLDLAVVTLDAVGLLLFLVPGVIAFAVDFSNGTIYLPPERTVFFRPGGQQDSQHFQTVHVNPAELTPQRLEAILREQTGQAIRLEPGSYRAAKISQIQDFTPDIINELQQSAPVVVRGTAQ